MKSPLLRLGAWLVQRVYRVNVTGKLPEGGCLLAPNHVTWVDAILLQAISPRMIRFLVYEPIYRQPLMNPIFRLMRAIPVSSTKPKGALKEAAELLKAGEVVCIFPEGSLSRSGALNRLRRGYELIARAADAPVVPVWLDQLWGSIFSFQKGRFFTKWPKRIPYPVTIAFGEPIPAAEAGIDLLRERMLMLGEQAYQQRPILKGHLGSAVIRGLKNRQFQRVVDDGMDGSAMDRGTLLAAGIALAEYLKVHCPERRIAIALPAGRGGMVANLAVVLAGKVPVNLNFTAGKAALEAAYRIGGMTSLITAGALLQKLPDMPQPEQVIRLEKVLPPLKKRIVRWRLAVMFLPAKWLIRKIGVPAVGDGDEALLLFTSGSSGDPKGVMLSHRNVIGNVSQFSQMLNLNPGDAILASLPFFHSFGCTVTLWFPMMETVRVVTYPSPVDAEKNAALIQKHGIKVVLATPTFLRGYLRKATREQFASVKLLVTGAEKLPNELAQTFEERLGVPVQQGYGLTETSPVVSVNLPDPPNRSENDESQPTSRLGSVGKLAPGIAAQIRDPETGRRLSLHETGMLWLRGPNMFSGYLGDPKRTAEMFDGAGWLKTGDLGRFDEDGFLYIEGRLSRFSKIAGEMVPHETLEARIVEALEIPEDAERTICIVGIPDEAKGEAIILLSTVEVELPALRHKLLAAGVPALWIPKVVRPVPAIPILASGKLDLRGAQEAAKSVPVA